MTHRLFMLHSTVLVYISIFAKKLNIEKFQNSPAKQVVLQNSQVPKGNCLLFIMDTYVFFMRQKLYFVYSLCVRQFLNLKHSVFSLYYTIFKMNHIFKYIFIYLQGNIIAIISNNIQKTCSNIWNCKYLIQGDSFATWKNACMK